MSTLHMRRCLGRSYAEMYSCFVLCRCAMRAHRMIVVLAILALAGPACRKAKPDPCTSNCQHRAAELGCAHAERCATECTKLLHASSCALQARAFVECFLKEPREHWECGNEGLPVMEGESCESEQANVSDCLQRTGGKL